MQKTTTKARRMVAMLAVAVMLLSAFNMTGLTAFAAAGEDLTEGTYVADADLSCFVSAMGGVEFGGGGISDGNVTIKVDSAGNKSITMNFATGGFVIYGVSAVTFLDPNPEAPDTSRGVTPGTMGIYAQDGTTIITDGVSYTVSGNTAANPQGNQAAYIDSITFPLPYDSDAYNLTFYLNSQVMGMQFCNPNAQATGTPYPANLSIDWDSAKAVKSADETSNQLSNVVYEVEGGYEVVIPSTIYVNSNTKIGEYEVVAKNFVITSGAYVTVITADAGTLSNGSATVPFANALESGKLAVTGDKLSGKITVTGNPTSTGVYSGTADFLISYFAG